MQQPPNHNAIARVRNSAGIVSRWAIVLATLSIAQAHAQQPTPSEGMPAGEPPPLSVDHSNPTNDPISIENKGPSTDEVTGTAPTPTQSADAYVPIVKSLFFTQEEMTSIRHALVSYGHNVANQSHNGEGEDFLRQLEGKEKVGPTQQKQYYTYPQFFLESLVYHSPKDWSIRVNAQRITAETAENAPGNLHVHAIDKDKVSLIWKPEKEDLDRINPQSKKSSDSRVDTSTEGTIAFALHGNQTFSSFTMTVLEGKMKPVIVKMSAADDRAAPSAPPPNMAPPAEAPPPSEPLIQERSGLPGLINSYKNLGKQDQNP